MWWFGVDHGPGTGHANAGSKGNFDSIKSMKIVARLLAGEMAKVQSAMLTDKIETSEAMVA